MWDKWESWSDCDAVCGEGIRSRIRDVKSPAVGNGTECEIFDETNEKRCYKENCTSTTSTTPTPPTTTLGYLSAHIIK